MTAIRQFAREAPVMVGLTVAVLLFDAYLLLLGHFTSSKSEYRLTPASAGTTIAEQKKPSPFGDRRKNLPKQWLPPVAERPGDAVLAVDQHRLMDAAYGGSVQWQN